MPILRTVADSNYVKEEGCAGRLLRQPMAVACTQTGKEGKTYLSAAAFPPAVPEDERVQQRVSALGKLTANWQSVVDGALISPVEQADRRKGQERLL
ncbi:MAG: hypothetical protein FJ387_07110 [Verrucomicrobia bacterium]|nr:hypothetical protein [Verrucomicrobiota bacterium]